MSSRIDSTFGTLADRVSSPAATRTPTRHIVVDGRFPGVLVSWQKEASGWFATAAYVIDERLVVERLPASRVRPA